MQRLRFAAMSVTASFVPERISASPGGTTALTLELQNHSDTTQMLRLSAGGGLASQTTLQSEWIHLDPNGRLDVPVVVALTPELPAGIHSCVIEIESDADKLQASATVDILESSSFSARLEPPESRSATAGRHTVAIENVGNAPLLLEVEVTSSNDLAAELTAPAINVDPGKTAEVDLRLSPRSRFWNGSMVDHPFTVEISGRNGADVTLDGLYRQGPRLRPWFAPAMTGMIAAFAIGALAWVFVLKSQVEDIAREQAATLDATQDADIQRQLDLMEAAAAEASELPLGEPVDLRLDVSSGPAASDTTSFVFDEDGRDRILSITDIIFQNPTGAVGTIELLRDDDVLQGSNMANFRDLDFHLVAPYQVDSRSELSLRVTCDTPGPGTDSCQVAATILGFVDER